MPCLTTRTAPGRTWPFSRTPNVEIPQLSQRLIFPCFRMKYTHPPSATNIDPPPMTYPVYFPSSSPPFTPARSNLCSISSCQTRRWLADGYHSCLKMKHTGRGHDPTAPMPSPSTTSHGRMASHAPRDDLHARFKMISAAIVMSCSSKRRAVALLHTQGGNMTCLQQLAAARKHDSQHASELVQVRLACLYFQLHSL